MDFSYKEKQKKNSIVTDLGLDPEVSLKGACGGSDVVAPGAPAQGTVKWGSK
jgi:hypothetical protein